MTFLKQTAWIFRYPLGVLILFFGFITYANVVAYNPAKEIYSMTVRFSDGSISTACRGYQYDHNPMYGDSLLVAKINCHGKTFWSYDPKYVNTFGMKNQTVIDSGGITKTIHVQEYRVCMLISATKEK